MANVIEDIYRLDVDPNSALNIAKLAANVTKLNDQLDKTTKEEAELTAQTKQLNAAINQNVTTVAGLERKNQLLKESLRGLTIGSREYNTVQKELNKTNAQLDTAFGKSSGVASQLKGAIGGLVAPYLGVAGAIAIVTKSIQAYGEKEALINQLSLVLNGNAEALKRLADQEDRIEKLTLFDGDDIQKAQTYAITAGRSVAETEKLIEVSTDLAAVRKISVAEATQLLINGEDGYFYQLRKSVPEIRNYTDEQIKAGIATEALGKKIKGAAEGLAVGTTGILNQAQDKIGETTEAFGEFFVIKIPAFLTTMLIVLSDGALLAANYLSTGFALITKGYLKVQQFFGKDVRKGLLQNREDLADLRDEREKLATATVSDLFDADVARRRENARAKAQSPLQFDKVTKGGAVGSGELAPEEKQALAGSFAAISEEISKLNKKLQEEVTLETNEAIIKGLLDGIDKLEQQQEQLKRRTALILDPTLNDIVDQLKIEPKDLFPVSSLDSVDFQKQIADLRDKVSTELVKPKAKEKKTTQQIIEEVFGISENVIQIFSDAIVSPFEQAAQRLDQLVDKQRNAYENALTNSEDFNDAQIELERTRLIESEAQQRQAAEKARTASQIQVAAYTAIAIARAVAEGGGVFSFAKVAAVLAALAGGLSQIGSITQGFHDGSDFVTGKRGRDKIPAMIEYGEAVIQADANEKYHPLVKDIRRKTKHADFALKALEASKSGQAALGYQIFNDFSPLVSEQKKTNKILKEQSNVFKNTRIRVGA